ncbi:MAG TPA: hypothetical protein VMZ90_03950, partial [Vicinamibacterales bacterium]|nr:hypothetical protein [Vicinamibacterales bacterium]
MNSWPRISVLCAALLLALPAFAQPPADASARAVASADQPSKTARGVAFILPAGWTQAADG